MPLDALDDIAGIADLAALDERDPQSAARVALRAASVLQAARKEQGLALLRAEPPDRLVVAALDARCKHLSARITKRPTPPAYRIERAPIRSIVKTADDVIAFVEAHGGFATIWTPCVYASSIDVAERFAKDRDALLLGQDVEAIAEVVRRVLLRRKALLGVEDMLRITSWGYMFTEATAPTLEGHEELRTPEACLDVLERLVDVSVNDTFEPPDHELGRFLIRRLAAAKHAPACELLAALAAVHTPYSRVKGDAVAALRELGGPASVHAIIAALERAIDDAIVDQRQARLPRARRHEAARTGRGARGRHRRGSALGRSVRAAPR